MFGFFKSKKKEETYTPMLHGVNLNKWHYLGKINLTFTSGSSCMAFLFAKKDNLDIRCYKLPTDIAGFFKENHSFIINALDTWVIGEKELYSYVKLEPSKWLSEYMLNTYNSVWDTSTNWWVSSENAKYNKSVTQQKKTKPIEKDNAVIQVDFRGKST